MSKISLYLLGDVKLVPHKGIPTKILRDSRVHQLLVYLATRSTQHRYTDLITIFDSKFTGIRHDLDRQSESLIGLPFDSYIEHQKYGKNTVSLAIKSPEVVTTDIDDLYTALSRWIETDTERWTEEHLSLLVEAVNIYRGDFLQSFKSEFSNFTNWMLKKRRTFRHVAAWASIQLMYASWSQNQLGHARSIGETWLQKDSLCHQWTGWHYYLLICIAYWSNEPERAEHIFDTYNRNLQDQKAQVFDKDIGRWSKMDELMAQVENGQIPQKPMSVVEWENLQATMVVEIPPFLVTKITGESPVTDEELTIIAPQSGSPSGININDIVQLLRGGAQSEVDPERLLLGRIEILKTVRRYWIDHVFKPSLEGVPKLDLQFTERPHSGLARIYPDESVSGNATRSFKEIDQVFDGYSQKLLMLGNPGFGKTTALLYLTNQLLEQAEEDIRNPIPIVFNLSTWTSDYDKLENWLIDELRQTYKLSSEQIANHWVRTDSIIILLDGLDEVTDAYRHDCVNAINQYIATHGLLSAVVVTCRLDDYHALNTKPNLNGAIVMQALSNKQVERFLDEASGITTGMLQFIENNVSVQNLLITPLVLNLMVRAFKHIDGTMYEQITVKDEHLFSHYVRRMYERRAGEKPYTYEETVHYLKQLASSMNQEHMLHLELLQPSWLTENKQGIYRFVVWILSTIFATIFGLVSSISAGSMPGAPPHSRPIETFLMFGALMWLFFSPKQLWRNPAYSLVPGILGGLGAYIHFALFGEITQVVYFEMLSSFIRFSLMAFIGVGIFALLRLQPDRIKPSEELKFSLKHSDWRGGLAGFVSGISIYTLYALSEVSFFTLGFLIGMFVSGIVIGVTVLLLTAFRSVDVERRVQPNQGIRASLNYAFLFSLFGLLFTIGLLTGLAISTPLHYAVWRSVGLGLFLMYPLWFIFGGLAVIQHYVLRLMLENERRIPSDIEGFLDHAVSLILMRRVGGGYTFIHKSLQDYFVNLAE